MQILSDSSSTNLTKINFIYVLPNVLMDSSVKEVYKFLHHVNHQWPIEHMATNRNVVGSSPPIRKSLPRVFQWVNVKLYFICMVFAEL